MKCVKCNGELAVGARVCPNCKEPVSVSSWGVNTGGGPYFGGTVTATRGNVVVGDVSGSVVAGQQGASIEELAKLFQAVYGRIDAHATDPKADTELLKETANKIEQEATKGDQADTTRLRRWLTTLGKLAPDVLEVAVNALANPGAAAASVVRVASEFLTAPQRTEDTSAS